MALEFVDRPLDDVALLVALRVERWGAAAVAAAPQPVVRLVGRLRNGRGDSASPQVSPDRSTTVERAKRNGTGGPTVG